MLRVMYLGSGLGCRQNWAQPARFQSGAWSSSRRGDLEQQMSSFYLQYRQELMTCVELLSAALAKASAAIFISISQSGCDNAQAALHSSSIIEHGAACTAEIVYAPADFADSDDFGSRPEPPGIAIKGGRSFRPMAIRLQVREHEGRRWVASCRRSKWASRSVAIPAHALCTEAALSWRHIKYVGVSQVPHQTDGS